jgi:hypothetical protein
MQGVMRAICIAYLVFLSLLLLSEDPTRVIGLHGRLPAVLRALMPYAHVVSFAVLALLALGVRWPVARWGILLMLAAYGGMTEILQGFVPHRTADWMDWFQDLGGMALGTALCWSAAIVIGKWARSRRTEEAEVRAASSEEWNVLQKSLSRPVRGQTSWWS